MSRILHERSDPGENPAFADRVGEEAAQAMVRTLLEVIREERAASW